MNALAESCANADGLLGLSRSCPWAVLVARFMVLCRLLLRTLAAAQASRGQSGYHRQITAVCSLQVQLTELQLFPNA